MSTKQQDRKKQALHNEEACNHLESSGKFNDWVVTTAFYSAMHFVQYKIFPIKIKGEKKERTFNCFDDYYSAQKFELKGVSKHKATVNLVNENLPSISSKYRRLKDLCWSARYNSYKVDPLNVTLSKVILMEIKKECI